jgi:hypothetical protein
MFLCLTQHFYVIHFRAYDQYSKGDTTYAQYYCLFINLCLLLPQHVSANSDAIIRGVLLQIA